jgi:hypothetical protein
MTDLKDKWASREAALTNYHLAAEKIKNRLSKAREAQKIIHNGMDSFDECTTTIIVIFSYSFTVANQPLDCFSMLKVFMPL